MSRTISALILGCVCAALTPTAGASAADAAPDAIKKDLDLLQGEWLMTTGALDGSPVSDDVRTGFKRILKGDELAVTNGDTLIMKAKITLDPTKSPKAIDYEVVEGATKGKKHLGIYAIDGDTMKSCFAQPDRERPTEFSTTPGDRRTLSTWQRAKKP